MNTHEKADKTIKRKNDHINICENCNIDLKTDSFKDYKIIYENLPELNFDSIDTSLFFLNRKFKMPFMIAGMTGGVELSKKINDILAKAAVKFGIPMGLGSMRLMFNYPEYICLFDLKKTYPDLFLIGNIGAVTLNTEISLSELSKISDKLELDAIALHLNALQECIQPEGEKDFSNLLKKIEKAVKVLKIPIILKEVGTGISGDSFNKLINTGVKAVDISGWGGTNWSLIEGLRGNKQTERLGRLFSNTGIPTSKSLIECAEIKQKKQSSVEIIASGGIRDGIQAFKAIALGASIVGIGLPLFKAALSEIKDNSKKGILNEEISFFYESLKISMFCSASQNLNSLKNKLLYTELI